MLLLRRRRVRLHQANAPTVEGLLVRSWDGALTWNGHYRLLKPAVLETTERTFELEGEAWIPREKVIFVETVRT